MRGIILALRRPQYDGVATADQEVKSVVAILAAWPTVPGLFLTGITR